MKKTKIGKWLASLSVPVLIIIVAATSVAAMAVATVVYVVNENKVEDESKVESESKVVLSPNTAPSADSNALEVSTDGETSKLSSSDGGGSVSLSYSDKINVNLSRGSATIYFQNPAQSNQDMVIQVIITDGDDKYLVAQSDKLTAGYLLQHISLTDDIKSMLQTGTYKGIFNILYYNPNNGEKAIVNTNIPVDISVIK